MGYVRERDFNREDTEHPGYSKLEYDLFAKLGLTIRKNIKDNLFEIARIKDRCKIYSGTLEQMVDKANELEGNINTVIKE